MGQTAPQHCIPPDRTTASGFRGRTSGVAACRRPRNVVSSAPSRQRRGHKKGVVEVVRRDAHTRTCASNRELCRAEVDEGVRSETPVLQKWTEQLRSRGSCTVVVVDTLSSCAGNPTSAALFWTTQLYWCQHVWCCVVPPKTTPSVGPCTTVHSKCGHKQKRTKQFSPKTASPLAWWCSYGYFCGVCTAELCSETPRLASMSHRWCLLILAAAILVPGTTPEWLAPQIHPLEQTLKSIHSDYLGSAKVYRYPDPPGQSREELVHCYRMLHRGCGENQTGRKESADFMQGEPCDPDDDASPWSSQGGGYLPEDLSELFILPEGNVDNIDDPDIDLYIVNPFVSCASSTVGASILRT